MDLKKNGFSNISKLYFYEGQKTKDRFGSFHLDAQKYSGHFKEVLLHNLVKKIKTCANFSDAPDCTTHEFFMRSFATSRRIALLDLTKTKSCSLHRLFLKYLLLRRPHLTEIQREGLAFVVLALLLEFGIVAGQDFDPHNLWKLLSFMWLFQTIDAMTKAWLSYEVKASNKFKIIINSDSWEVDVFHISLIGEFIYFISTMHSDSDSPILQIRKHSTESEYLLIDEISQIATSKLGILTYISFRNCASNFRNKLAQEIFDDLDLLHEIFPNIHKSYLISVENVRQIPILDHYYKMFLTFFRTEINQAAFYFGNEKTIFSMEYFNGLQDFDNVMDYDLGDKVPALVFYLKIVADVFLFLYEKNSEFTLKAFRNIPKYIENYATPQELIRGKANIFMREGIYHCVEVMLFSTSILLDFLFIENWLSDVSDYVQICNEIKIVLDSQNEIVREVVINEALFPFM